MDVDREEISKFEELAERWWDPESEFKPLHQINPLRLTWIDNTVNGLNGSSVLDLGCGGGILSEAMAKLGAIVTGVDPAERSIKVAKIHAEKINSDVITNIKSLSDVKGISKALQSEDTVMDNNEFRESCSCLEGNPCVYKYNCKDWTNREAIAKAVRKTKGMSEVFVTGGV